jgi:dTMP kinase
VSKRGVLVVFEGVEGVGKTTQWQKVAERLDSTGYDSVRVREPGGTDVGNAIRHIVLDAPVAISSRSEALLFAASRAELIEQVIEPALTRGGTVLLDRFLLSTYAYQGAGRGIDLEALRAINAFATCGVVPDLTLLLTLPLDAALCRASARSASDRIEREDRSFHARVAAAFTAATASDWQARHPECGPVVAVDASGDADAVTDRCLAHLAGQWPARFGALLNSTVSSSTIRMPA